MSDTPAPTLLAIETASEACSVALRRGGETAFRFESLARKQAELVLPMVDSLLAEAGIQLNQLDAVAFSRGPGSFTGLRVAAGVVQGLSYGADLPVVAVSTLAALAHQGFRLHGWQRQIAALDARMGELYWGCFETRAEGDTVLHGEERVTVPESLQQASTWACNGVGSGGVKGIGAGWQFRPQIETGGRLVDEVDTGTVPHALDVIALGQRLWQQGCVVDAAEVAPVYLRNNVAAKPGTKTS